MLQRVICKRNFFFSLAFRYSRHVDISYKSFNIFESSMLVSLFGNMSEAKYIFAFIIIIFSSDSMLLIADKEILLL